VEMQGWYLRTTPGFLWAIPTPGLEAWGALGAALGAVTGLVISNLLLRFGIIRRSFADFEDWERGELEKSSSGQSAEAGLTLLPDVTVGQGQPPSEASAGPAAAVPGAPPAEEAQQLAAPELAPPAHAAPAPSESDTAELWIQYPHARREMIKELAFLSPAAMLALAGWYIAERWAGVALDPIYNTYTAAAQMPLWLSVLAGVLIGYLVGGGIVWAVRIFGSLGFGKEAMGLGDVHIMAAIGACLGWIDATLAFFGAAFVGIAWALPGRLFSGRFWRPLAYGPSLAIATVLVLLTKPALERLFSLLMGQTVNIP
jgi:leader peptidase (prepilin peptidase) / N-methyltransferase